MKKTVSIILSVILLALASVISGSCTDSTVVIKRLTNNSHLVSLYEDIEVDENKMAIIHIYAEYPDYHWVADDDEGGACIDDAARAAVYFIRDYKHNDDNNSLERAKNLLEFILYMQDENGYFYNFIFPDHTINREHKNSVNRPGWWSWRALWSLTEAYQVVKITDPELAERYMRGIKKTINSLKDYLVVDREMEELEGLKTPTWLPYKYASDQASLLIMCLSNYYNSTKDDSVLDYITLLADGIMLMQVNDNKSNYYGALLSWMNNWHAWGNLQSYSLLVAHQITGKSEYLESALNEINNYYQYLYKIKYLSDFSIRKENDSISVLSEKVYSQIAYGIRPMVYAALEAYKITGERKYAEYAANYAGWFFGDNIQKTTMYFHESGIAYDGMSENYINKNSGAESTIEALLSLQEIEQNETAFSHLNNKINE